MAPSGVRGGGEAGGTGKSDRSRKTSAAVTEASQQRWMLAEHDLQMVARNRKLLFRRTNVVIICDHSACDCVNMCVFWYAWRREDRITCLTLERGAGGFKEFWLTSSQLYCKLLGSHGHGCRETWWPLILLCCDDVIDLRRSQMVSESKKKKTGFGVKQHKHIWWHFFGDALVSHLQISSLSDHSATVYTAQKPPTIGVSSRTWDKTLLVVIIMVFFVCIGNCRG